MQGVATEKGKKRTMDSRCIVRLGDVVTALSGHKYFNFWCGAAFSAVNTILGQAQHWCHKYLKGGKKLRHGGWSRGSNLWVHEEGRKRENRDRG